METFLLAPQFIMGIQCLLNKLLFIIKVSPILHQELSELSELSSLVECVKISDACM